MAGGMGCSHTSIGKYIQDHARRIMLQPELHAGPRECRFAFVRHFETTVVKRLKDSITTEEIACVRRDLARAMLTSLDAWKNVYLSGSTTSIAANGSMGNSLKAIFRHEPQEFSEGESECETESSDSDMSNGA
jgi:hypothetical protein